MSGPCACFTSMYIQNMLVVHAFVVIWRFVYTFCRPSLASYGMCYFLASHSLKLTPFGAGLLLGRGLFILQPTLLLFSTVFMFPTVPLCYSYFGVIRPKPAGPLWACCLRAPVSHFPFGHPWPIYFSWAFLALFLTLHSYGLLLTPLGFPGLIILSLILGTRRLAINTLLSLLALLRACCCPFSLFYITYCPWVCHFSLFKLF